MAPQYGWCRSIIFTSAMTYIEILQQLIHKLEKAGETAEANKMKAIANKDYATQTEWVGETSLAAVNMVRYNEKLDRLIGAEAFDLKQYAKDMGLEVS